MKRVDLVVGQKYITKIARKDKVVYLIQLRDGDDAVVLTESGNYLYRRPGQLRRIK